MDPADEQGYAQFVSKNVTGDARLVAFITFIVGDNGTEQLSGSDSFPVAIKSIQSGSFDSSFDMRSIKAGSISDLRGLQAA